MIAYLGKAGKSEDRGLSAGNALWEIVDDPKKVDAAYAINMTILQRSSKPSYLLAHFLRRSGGGKGPANQSS